VAEEVCSRLLTSEAGFRSQFIPCEIFMMDKYCWGRVFSEYRRVSFYDGVTFSNLWF